MARRRIAWARRVYGECDVLSTCSWLSRSAACCCATPDRFVLSGVVARFRPASPSVAAEASHGVGLAYRTHGDARGGEAGAGWEVGGERRRRARKGAAFTSQR